jgi:hypothetical protein
MFCFRLGSTDTCSVSGLVARHMFCFGLGSTDTCSVSGLVARHMFCFGPGSTHNVQIAAVKRYTLKMISIYRTIFLFGNKKLYDRHHAVFTLCCKTHHWASTAIGCSPSVPLKRTNWTAPPHRVVRREFTYEPSKASKMKTVRSFSTAVVNDRTIRRYEN